MRARRSYASAPAPLSSIFSPKIPEGGGAGEVGARGGGFTIRRGVETYVEYLPGEADESELYLNDSRTSFITSVKSLELLRKSLGLKGRVILRHRVHVPIGAGFGVSASIALTTILALFKVADRGITLREACRLVHEIEVECRTGLNSEAGFLSEGLVLVLGWGSPSRLILDSIPIPRDSLIISISASSLGSSRLLESRERLRAVEEVGDRKLEEILRHPTPENFLQKSKEFAVEAGLATEEVQEIFEELERLPVIGYAQNMLGRACHALALKKRADEVAARLRSVFPEYRVGVHEVGNEIRVSGLV